MIHICTYNYDSDFLMIKRFSTELMIKHTYDKTHLYIKDYLKAISPKKIYLMSTFTIQILSC